jgi:phosphatidylinositol glycan class S
LHPHKNDDDGAYYFKGSDLPYIVDSNSWNLDFVADPSETLLNFVLHVPEKRFSPLYIKSSDTGYSKSNAYLIPQWGGVAILNPDYSIAGEQKRDLQYVKKSQLFIESSDLLR